MHQKTLMDHLLNNQLIGSSQHGFLPAKSVTTNMLEFVETVTNIAVQWKSYTLTSTKSPMQCWLRNTGPIGRWGKLVSCTGIFLFGR